MGTPIVFVSGMPRSGSTLLQNLLAQNPFNHVTPTNDLLDVIMRVRDFWMTTPGFIAQGLDVIKPRMLSACRGIIEGFYRGEFQENKTVFDKSRGHLSQIELLEEILERPIKVIVTLRDIRDVLASFEKIRRRSFFTDHPVSGEQSIQQLTVEGRCSRLLSQDFTVGFAVAALRDAYVRGVGDRLVLVRYRELTRDPVRVIRQVHRDIGLPDFRCDPSCVKQVTYEDDTVYGMPLHAVRPVVEPDAGPAWPGVLPEPLAAKIDAEYRDIQDLTHGNVTHLAVN